MARGEQQAAVTRNGVGTLARTGARPQQAGAAGQAVPDQRRARPSRQAAQRTPPGGPRAEAGTGTAGRRDQRVPAQRPAPQAVTTGPRRRPGVPPQAPPAQRSRVTGPQPALAPAQPLPGQPQVTRPGQEVTRRVPFVVLLCGLLGGALVSALVVSTTLAEGSFQISSLQASTSALAKQQQALQEQVAQAQAPQQIAQRAAQLGMRRVGELRFLDLATGKVTTTGPTWIGAVNAPGYAP